ncbi:MAG TPA: DinB family protein [Dehalococcoidia bacterium]|nr:DinB family protein [Dehalococcoidia bacterium]
MAENREALLKNYKESREALLAAIDGLSDEKLTECSIDGWSVKDHLAHIAFWDDIRSSEVVRITAGHDSAWRMIGEQDEDYNRIGYDLRRDLSLGQIKWELANSRERLLDAISSANERGLDPSLYGEAGLVSGHEAEHTTWLKRWRSGLNS